MWWLLVLLLLVRARVEKAAVVVRVPKRGKFVLLEDGAWKQPSATKLQDEETQRMMDLGRKLRELYIRSSRLLPPHFDSSRVLFHSADTPRSIAVTQAVGAGLYPSFASGLGNLLPVSVISQPLDDLFGFPCRSQSLPSQQQQANEAEMRTLAERFGVVAGGEGKEVGDWILESVPLRGNSTLPQTSVLQSRLAHEVYVKFFASSAQHGMRVFVLEDWDVMGSFLGRTGGTAALPELAVIELHDETEIDPHSPQRFVQIQVDHMAQDCALEHAYCESSAYIASIAGRLQSHEEWKKTCESVAADGKATLVPSPPIAPVPDNSTIPNHVNCPPPPPPVYISTRQWKMTFTMGSFLEACSRGWSCTGAALGDGRRTPNTWPG
ncbi:hypothetical protein BASA81_003472 [Batrachochytrium salamandrivorans]|nr:hypothetical protein BASA81_003472 [Batrachochytrium salamandrivorans]